MMNKMPPRRNLSRRDLLKIASAGGAAAAGGYALYESAPWLDYEAQANHVRRPLERDSTLATQMMGLIRYATLAASSHNTQPWKFVIRPDAIEIHPDYTRCLSVIDPGSRELWISLGCALENLLIAALAMGYAVDVTYPDAADFIHVRLIADGTQGSPLFDAIPLRQNTRSEYDGKPIKASDLDPTQAIPLEPGVSLHWVLAPAELKTVADYVRQGDLGQYADKDFVKELIYWLRFDKREALASCAGLYSRCSGSPETPRWLGQMFVNGAKPQQQAEADIKKLLSSSGAVVVASTAEDKTAWVRTGQVYERMALTMTALNIKSAFLNQPIEVAGLRGPFQNAIGLGASHPQLLIRFGYAASMPRSLRRPVEQTLLPSQPEMLQRVSGSNGGL